MTASTRWRDAFAAWTPIWLSDRPGQQSGETFGYRVLWVLHATIDKLTEAAVQGFISSLPGYGSPRALPLIGASRGLLQGRSDTAPQYSSRLQAWRQKWLLAGTRVGLAMALHEYLPGRPQVEVVNRGGSWTRVDVAGGITTFRSVPWSWDGTSNPERAGYWSDLWIIVRTPYSQRTLPLGSAFAGMTSSQLAASSYGHVVPQDDATEARAIIAQWKSAGSRIRAVIWTTSATRFNPLDSTTLPDGTWGTWAKTDGSGAYVPGNRDTTECRYWEFP